MLPAILGLGGLTAKIIATAVIPRVVRAISQSFSATRPAELCPSPAVEGISSGPEPAPAPVLSGVSATRIKSRKWGYAGLWHHQASGLDLATYRLYDAANKRWISRDPLGEGVDLNLYRYCGNNPISNIDPMGLDSAPPGYDPIAFRKGKYKKSEVKGVCPRQTLEVTAMLGAAGITAFEWTMLGLDIAAWHQMTRGAAPPSSPPSSPFQNAPLRTTQDRVSGPVVDRYVQRLRNGETPPPIRVDNGVIVDGNHRYAAGRIVGVDPPQTPGTMAPSQAQNIIDFSQVRIDPVDYGNR